MAEDYYSILGVPRDANPTEIKAAYQRLARQNHPDRFRDAAERREADRRFQQINESYNHLRDVKLRREYDKKLEEESTTPSERAAGRHRDGRLLEQAGEYDQSLRYYYEAMQLDPANVTYIVATARVLRRDRSKHRQAAEMLEQAMIKHPGFRELYLELGALYSSSGLLLRACRVYEMGLKVNPQDPEFRRLHSQASAAAQRSKK